MLLAIYLEQISMLGVQFKSCMQLLLRLRRGPGYIACQWMKAFVKAKSTWAVKRMQGMHQYYRGHTSKQLLLQSTRTLSILICKEGVTMSLLMAWYFLVTMLQENLISVASLTMSA